VANAPIPSNDDVKVFGLNAVGTGHGKSGRFKKTREGLCACVKMCLLGQLEVRNKVTSRAESTSGGRSHE
jgi:hypothetical protein